MSRTTPFTLSSIQSRLLVVVLVALTLMLGGLGTISWLAIRESTNRSLEERLALARVNADHLGYVLNENMVMLGSVVFAPGASLPAATPEQRQALHDIFITSIFDGGLYVVDASGKVLMAEPERSSGAGIEIASYPPLASALSTGKPVISDIYRKGNGEDVISAVVPVNRGGVLAGAIVGDIDPTGPGLRKILPPVRLGDSGYVEVVDSGGTVVASSLPGRVLENSDHANILRGLIERRETISGKCHNCHEGQSPEKRTEVMAFAPLIEEWVKWGVVIRQSEEEALAPSRNLFKGILAVSIPALTLSIVLAWGMAQSVSRPIVSLTGAARWLSRGDLSRPIRTSGTDEISTLSWALEGMRSKLSDSLEEITRWNALLESKVEERTNELERLYKELKAKEANREELLRKVMTAQEEERKRLARDLHDDTSQTLAALVMQLDAYEAPLASGSDPTSKLVEIRAAARKSLDSIRRVILDLRPSILDDLGLVSAIRWYAESRLQDKDVKVRVETNDYDKRLPNGMETALFRIVQEAVTNIVRHANAENAVIAVDFRDSEVAVDIEDDGNGFDAGKAKAGTMSTFGIHGMQERVALLGGTIEIESHPGSGTRISVVMPLNGNRTQNA